MGGYKGEVKMSSMIGVGVPRESQLLLRSVSEGQYPEKNNRKDNKKLKKACEDFEAVFISYLLKAMRKTVPKSGLWGMGREEEIFTEMRDEEFAKAMARRGALGVAGMLYRELSTPIQNMPIRADK